MPFIFRTLHKEVLSTDQTYGVDGMKITVIIATHKEKYKAPQDSCYLPLHVGRALTEEIEGMQGDDTGDNISEKNPYYCELTGLYWMWKNIRADYVGLVHYRRYFSSKSPLKTMLTRNKFSLIAGQKDYEELLNREDIILPRKRRYYIENLYSHYSHTHYAEHLDAARQVLAEMHPDYVSSFDIIMKEKSGHMFNMFLMSQEKCDEYCSWLFPILSVLETRLDFKEYTDYQARLFGRISELLFNVWLNKKHYPYCEMAIVNTERVHWARKMVSFLQAKFKNKKYDASF